MSFIWWISLQKTIDFYLESNGGLFASPNLESHLDRLVYGDVENDPIAREKKQIIHILLWKVLLTVKPICIVQM